MTSGVTADATTIGRTGQGAVLGRIRDGIAVFTGIPYGADTADHRFEPPRPAPPWTGVRDAFEFGDRSPQAGAPGGLSLFRDWGEHSGQSENCLALNVWTPGVGDGARRPVLVWLHGGGFGSSSGSVPVYDGRRLARRGDVVVVTVNHRLNVFGYLYLGQLGEELGLGERFADSGNAGMLDLVAALRWVRDNAEAFGGDPGNVTVFGESGGGGKVSMLMAMPAAAGLFHKAVVQSGAWLRALTPERATELARGYLERLGVRPGDPAAVADLARRPAAELVAALGTGRRSALITPVLDGRSVPRHPFEPDAAPISAGVPLLIGSNRDEMSLLAGARNPALFELTWDGLVPALAAFPSVGAEHAAGLADAYRELYPRHSPARVYFAITTDATIWRNTVRQAERAAARGGAPVYAYQLDWCTPVDGGKWGAPHALDLPLVFDTVASSPSMVGTGADAEAAQRVSDQMSEAWLAFARTGDPGTGALPAWPAYTGTERATMSFDLSPVVLRDPQAAQRALVEPLPLRGLLE
jgi:para-nitrobenzyl esterase